MWEQIFYGEFDGQRKKRVLAKTIGKQSRFSMILASFFIFLDSTPIL
jgi:hypothetical protein